MFSPPPQFPQFGEYRIAGPSSYRIPQWSPDSRYLAFIDSQAQTLMVYDSETRSTWQVAANVSSTHFSWTPNGDLTYLRYRPDLSGSPFPRILEMYQVGLRGENDRVIAQNLSNVRDFDWYSDGQRVAILLSGPASQTHLEDVYVLNTATGNLDLLLAAAEVNLQYIVSLVLSPDDKLILVYGVDGENGPLSPQLILYDLETRTVRNRVIPSQVIPPVNLTYPWAGIGDSSSFEWVGGQRWFLTNVSAPSGECYNSALFFFDMVAIENSFCIPNVGSGGGLGHPTISPDLRKISYITIDGPTLNHIMIGNVPASLLNTLELETE